MASVAETHAEAVKALLSSITGNDYKAPTELVQIHASTTVEEAIKILTDSNKSAAPVYDEVVDEVRYCIEVPLSAWRSAVLGRVESQPAHCRYDCCLQCRGKP